MSWLVVLGVLAAGCATGGPPTGVPPSAPRPPAAEPAQAPPAQAPPNGQVIPVGPGAEGIVADPVSGVVAVAVRGPSRLVLLDARTGAGRGAVPLPGDVRHLQLAAPGGPVLVPVESASRLLRIGLPGGAVLGNAATAGGPHDSAAAANGLVFVADEGAGVLSVLDGDQTVARFEEPVQPGGIAAAGNLVGLIDVRQSTLTLYDAAARRAVAGLPAGDGPTHVVADRRGRLVVADTRGGALLSFEVTPTFRLVSRVVLPGQPYGLAYDPTRDRLWVTLTGRNELVGLDLGSGAPREITRFATLRQPNTVAVDPATGRVFVASPLDAAVQFVDPPG